MRIFEEQCSFIASDYSMNIILEIRSYNIVPIYSFKLVKI